MPKRIIRHVTGLRLSEDEKTLLIELANEAGLTMSAYVRLLIKQADRERRTVQISPKKRAIEYAQ